MESVVSPNVHTTSPSAHFEASFDNVQSDITNDMIPRSPPLPARSPLRPRAATKPPPTVPQVTSHSSPFVLSPRILDPMQFHTLSSLSGSVILDKELPIPLSIDSLSPLSPVDIDDEGSSASSIITTPPNTISKRTHALLELLSSERAYASDLALIRDIHIPLALGQASPIHTSTSSPTSSGSSSRAVSTASDSSNLYTSTPAMTKEDVKIIFSNISELAVFADNLTVRLEEAIGSVLDGGQGHDRVGALFLEMIPMLEPPYTFYITRHPMALEHLNNLPQTPSLVSYLQHTHTLASSLTHAWDLPSLLIKPVQRLLKYSLLLTVIIDGTPDDHEDKNNLKAAKNKMDEVARGVNEDRRRREVVKEVLALCKREDNSNSQIGSTLKVKKKGLNVGVSASVSLVMMKGIRNVSKSNESPDGNHETVEIAKMEAELKSCEIFIRKFAQDAVGWGEAVKEMMGCLANWTRSFGRVIGISEDQNSESFEAFRMVIDEQISDLCTDLLTVIKNRLLVQLTILVETTLAPSRLLEALHNLEPLHHALLNLNVSKSRPAPSLLDASKSYVALRRQLFAELPQYLKLLHKGIGAAILQLAVWQGQFLGDVRERWSELWEALRVDGEMNIESSAETVRIWWDRFSIIEEELMALEIVNKRARSISRQHLQSQSFYQAAYFVEPKERKSAIPVKSSTSSLFSVLAALDSTSSSLNEDFVIPIRQSTSSSDQLPGPSRRSSNASKKRSARSPQPANRESYNIVDEFDFIGSPPSYSSVPQPMNSREGSLKGSPMRRRSTDTRRSSPGPERLPVNRNLEALQGPSRKSGMRRRPTDPMRLELPPTARRSPSLPSISRTRSVGFSKRSTSPIPSIPHGDSRRSHSVSIQRQSSIYTEPVMYECQAITTFDIGRDIRYEGIPFLTLDIGRQLGVLQEVGRPSKHPNLPIQVDDGEDCLLMARDMEGNVGWALASFLIPID